MVLESEIKKNKFRGAEVIKNLKEQVEWHKVELSSWYMEIFCFILSKHPEIISEDEYKRFLRQTKERIKNGLSKIEEFLEDKNQTGLQIKTNTGPWSFGKQIWFKDDPKVSNEEYTVIVEQVEKDFYVPLFTDTKGKSRIFRYL